MMLNALVISNETLTLDNLSTDILELAVKQLNDIIKIRKTEVAAELQNEIAQLQAKLAALTGKTVNDSSKVRIAAAKYRNPNNPNEVYGGHGKRPQWFVDALAMVQGDEEATNRVLDELRVV